LTEKKDSTEQLEVTFLSTRSRAAEKVDDRFQVISKLEQVAFLKNLEILLCEDSLSLQQEPGINEIRKRGRPLGPKNKSIKRTKSSFERAESTLKITSDISI
jgi:hypothetical protein